MRTAQSTFGASQSAIGSSSGSPSSASISAFSPTASTPTTVSRPATAFSPRNAFPTPASSSGFVPVSRMPGKSQSVDFNAGMAPAGGAAWAGRSTRARDPISLLQEHRERERSRSRSPGPGHPSHAHPQPALTQPYPRAHSPAPPPTRPGTSASSGSGSGSGIRRPLPNPLPTPTSPTTPHGTGTSAGAGAGRWPGARAPSPSPTSQMAMGMGMESFRTPSPFGPQVPPSPTLSNANDARTPSPTFGIRDLPRAGQRPHTQGQGHPRQPYADARGGFGGEPEAGSTSPQYGIRDLPPRSMSVVDRGYGEGALSPYRRREIEREREEKAREEQERGRVQERVRAAHAERLGALEAERAAQAEVERRLEEREARLRHAQPHTSAQVHGRGGAQSAFGGGPFGGVYGVQGAQPHPQQPNATAYHQQARPPFNSEASSLAYRLATMQVAGASGAAGSPTRTGTQYSSPAQTPSPTKRAFELDDAPPASLRRSPSPSPLSFQNANASARANGNNANASVGLPAPTHAPTRQNARSPSFANSNVPSAVRAVSPMIAPKPAPPRITFPASPSSSDDEAEASGDDGAAARAGVPQIAVSGSSGPAAMTRRAPQIAVSGPPAPPQIAVSGPPQIAISGLPEVSISGVPGDEDAEGAGPSIQINGPDSASGPGISISVNGATGRSNGSSNGTSNANANTGPTLPGPGRRSTRRRKPVPGFTPGSGASHPSQLPPPDTLGGLACAGCGGGIVGRIVSAMGVRWHPDCFRCSICDDLLEHVSSYESGGKPYCHLDYHENFAPRCYHCKTSIVDERFITLDDDALGKRTYHEEHFFCAECGDPFLSPTSTSHFKKPDGGGRDRDRDRERPAGGGMEISITGDGAFEDGSVAFTVYRGHPYCEKCHVRLRMPKCKGCGQAIRDHMEAVEALKGKWHWECFVCGGCQRPFEDPSFFQRGDKAYCEPCFSVIIKNEF